MRREDFKQILPIHLENCEKILAVKGKCWKASVRCKECPFSQTNNAKTGNGCWASYSSVLAKHYDSEDRSLIASCEEFLELFGGEKEKEIKRLEELLKVRDGVKEIIADVQEKAKRGRPAKEVQNG